MPFIFRLALKLYFLVNSSFPNCITLVFLPLVMIPILNSLDDVFKINIKDTRRINIDKTTMCIPGESIIILVLITDAEVKGK